MFKMANLLVASFLLVLVSSVIADKKYTDKYDNVDIDSILKSDRLLNNYANCLLDKGRCTPDAAEVKGTIHDALETDCEKCSEKQKKLGTKVINFLIKNRRSQWNELQAKYDPENKYVTKYRDRLKAEGVDI